MQSVSTFFKEEEDFLYQRGEKKAKEKMSHAFVKSLILESDLSDDQIGRIVKVEVDFVKERRAELNNK
ncbi:hypothetical protein DBR43_04950 [Pedobacter sp. KBW06]|uniref:hypothetical protein n=1 Tax=Pedobacter sp. KBW06 TaxID=2153359 RepID=UPI000F5B3F89|nr:hypothetical protein [Pedobacter sp. KBW06]RQO74736.1 hypothetical protein DBR43_04950 [Pedobacter sp. KBW06]